MSKRSEAIKKLSLSQLQGIAKSGSLTSAAAQYEINRRASAEAKKGGVK